MICGCLGPLAVALVLVRVVPVAPGSMLVRHQGLTAAVLHHRIVIRGARARINGETATLTTREGGAAYLFDWRGCRMRRAACRLGQLAIGGAGQRQRVRGRGRGSEAPLLAPQGSRAERVKCAAVGARPTLETLTPPLRVVCCVMSARDTFVAFIIAESSLFFRFCPVDDGAFYRILDPRAFKVI